MEARRRRRRSVGPRREGAAPAQDEFLTVAASGGQARNAREFPGYAGNKSVCIIIKRVRGRGGAFESKYGARIIKLAHVLTGKAFQPMKISFERNVASRFIVSSPPRDCFATTSSLTNSYSVQFPIEMENYIGRRNFAELENWNRNLEGRRTALFCSFKFLR